MSVEQNKSPNGIQIRLTTDEAIVLFELLSRWTEDKNAATPEASCFECTAEGAVLHSLLAGLEKQLVAPFKDDFENLLDQARDRLKGAWNYPTLRS